MYMCSGHPPCPSHQIRSPTPQPLPAIILHASLHHHTASSHPLSASSPHSCSYEPSSHTSLDPITLDLIALHTITPHPITLQPTSFASHQPSSYQPCSLQPLSNPRCSHPCHLTSSPPPLSIPLASSNTLTATAFSEHPQPASSSPSSRYQHILLTSAPQLLTLLAPLSPAASLPPLIASPTHHLKPPQLPP